jgi:ParB family chromosome partitioning protein
MAKAAAAVLDEMTALINARVGQGSSKPREQRAIPAPTQLAQYSIEFKKLREELDTLKAKGAQGMRVPLDKLLPSPFQLRPLDENRVQRLVGNLAKNPLNSPVVVRKAKEDGFFELIAGHHRAEALRRLGHTDVLAVESQADDDLAERLVFYDNLLAPELTDYEKYLGFARRRESRKFTYAELAEESGVSKSSIALLMAFERLPAEAQALVASEPDKFSARAFGEGAKFADTNPELVVEAFHALAEGRLSVSELPAWFDSRLAGKVAVSRRADIRREKKPPTVIQRGDVVVATVEVKRKSLKIDFASTSLARELTPGLLAWLNGLESAESLPEQDN